MINFSLFITTTLYITILIGQSSTAITPNSNQSVNTISQKNNQVNNTLSNSSTDSCVESSKEAKNTRKRRRNSETRRGRDRGTSGPPKRGDKNTPKIISPVSQTISNKPTIEWCAVKGATSYDIYLVEASGEESWKNKKSKEDAKTKYPALLQLIYPSDEPPLKREILYKVTIQAKKDGKKHGSPANETFRFIKTQNN